MERTFDVVRWIHARHLQRVGHVLHMDAIRLVHKTAKHIHVKGKEGNFMDVPRRYSWQELQQLASNRDNWRARGWLLIQPPQVEVAMYANVEGV